MADAYLAVYPGKDPKADVMASIRDGLYGFAAQCLVRQQAATGQGGTAWPRFTAKERDHFDIDAKPVAARDLQPAAGSR